MPLINILSPHVADLIAAGEVVERPASAVKELIENSFDAGASTVVVEIRGGGRELIRIKDDGCGMAPEDAGVCFLRHATSKIHNEEDIAAIGTLGFRGEALAAISAISRITMTTRRKDAPHGVRMTLTAGDIDDMTETGCAEGTTIEIRDLFFNTPARMKFLSSDRSEGAACVHAAMCAALGHPEISVRCLKDGEEMFFSPGDGRADSAVYALLGRDFSLHMLPAADTGTDIRVSGFVASPEYCRGNRAAQYFFVNGRPIRSRSLQTALEQAYKNTAMVGKFPFCVLYITLANGLVDVNVHPTKAEVKFSREKDVFNGVYLATLSALHKEDRLSTPIPKDIPRELPSVSNTVSSGKTAPREDFFRSMSSTEYHKELGKKGTVSPNRSVNDVGRGYSLPVKSSPAPSNASSASQTVKYDRTVKSALLTEEQSSEPAKPYTAESEPLPKENNTAPAPVPVRETKIAAVDASEQVALESTTTADEVRYIGEAMNTYILMQHGDQLIIIDKHAAHERMLFDRFRSGEKEIMSQQLLIAETVKLTPERADALEANREVLEHLGFEAEPYGPDTYALRAVPSVIDAAESVSLLEELVEKLVAGRSLDLKDIRESLAESIACKAAIKAGWKTEPAELKILAAKVLSGEIKYCPHGRPVATVITRTELDKRFSRIV